MSGMVPGRPFPPPRPDSRRPAPAARPSMGLLELTGARRGMVGSWTLRLPAGTERLHLS